MPSAATKSPALVAGPSCCPTGLGAPIGREAAEELASLLKAVADATRLQILALLRSTPECTACVCDIADEIGVSQPTVSHHLKVLTDAGLIDREKRGTWVWYSVNQERWQQDRADCENQMTKNRTNFELNDLVRFRQCLTDKGYRLMG